MNIVDRYLLAVRAFLPRATQEDIIKELSEDIRSRIEDREEALGRPLTAAEEESLVKELGHPALLAGRYGPRRRLIGPELFPFYWLVLKLALGVGVAVHLAIAIAMFSGGHPGQGAPAGHRRSAARRVRAIWRDHHCVCGARFLWCAVAFQYRMEPAGPACGASTEAAARPPGAFDAGGRLVADRVAPAGHDLRPPRVCGPACTDLAVAVSADSAVDAARCGATRRRSGAPAVDACPLARARRDQRRCACDSFCLMRAGEWVVIVDAANASSAMRSVVEVVNQAFPWGFGFIAIGFIATMLMQLKTLSVGRHGVTQAT